MTPRRLLGFVPVLALTLALCALSGCKDKDKGKGGGKGDNAQAGADLMTRCDQQGKACGDNDKHTQKIMDECKVAAKEQVVSGCTEKTVAAYDCYEKELCGKGDKVWALDDLRVLSERHVKCAAERQASQTCVGN
jgi:hypothetical protein